MTFKWHYFCRRKHRRWARHTLGGKCRKITSVLGGRSLRGEKRVWSTVWGVATGWWGRQGYPWVGSYCQGRNWQACQTAVCAGRTSDPHLKSLWWREGQKSLSIKAHLKSFCTDLYRCRRMWLFQCSHLEEWSLSWIWTERRVRAGTTGDKHTKST